MPRQNMEFLNSKARKEVYRALEETYGFDGPKDEIWFTSGKDRLYLTTRAIEELPENFRIMQGGLYVGQWVSDGLRLSMDGAQHFGKYCTAKKIEITKDQLNQYMKGFDLETDQEDTDWSLVICGEDILCCSKIKDGKILNFISKGRRVMQPHD